MKALVKEKVMERRGPMIERVRDMLLEGGAVSYDGEAISQLEHALQTAWLAEKAGAPQHLVAAALLHDLGHLLYAAGGDTQIDMDDGHEGVGATFLAGWLDRTAVEPIRLHVAAKRYLCATEPSYYNTLSETSKHSLQRQGGIFTAEQAKEFIGLPSAADAVAVRRWDEQAKVVGLETPAFDHFLPALLASVEESN